MQLTCSWIISVVGDVGGEDELGQQPRSTSFSPMVRRDETIEDRLGQLGTRPRHIPRPHSHFVFILAPTACISLEEEGSAYRRLDLHVSSGTTYRVLSASVPSRSVPKTTCYTWKLLVWFLPKYPIDLNTTPLAFYGRSPRKGDPEGGPVLVQPLLGGRSCLRDRSQLHSPKSLTPDNDGSTAARGHRD
jgi:hypothetical protein